MSITPRISTAPINQGLVPAITMASKTILTKLAVSTSPSLISLANTGTGFLEVLATGTGFAAVEIKNHFKQNHIQKLSSPSLDAIPKKQLNFDDGKLTDNDFTSVPITSPTIDPWLNGKKNISSRFIQPLLKFYEVRFGREKLEELARTLGTTISVLENKELLFSSERIIELNRTMIRLTGDPGITRKAGRAFGEPAIMGPLFFLARETESPKMIYNSFQSFAESFLKGVRWEIDHISSGYTKLRYIPDKGVLDDKTFCLNRLGVIEGTPLIFKMDAAIVKHTTCLHVVGKDGKKGSECVYEARWIHKSRLEKVDLWGGGLMLGLSAPLSAIGLLHASDSLPILGSLMFLRGIAFIKTRQRTSDSNEFNKEHSKVLLEDNKRKANQNATLRSLLQKQYVSRVAKQQADKFIPNTLKARLEALSTNFEESIDLDNLDISTDPNMDLEGGMIHSAFLFCDITGFTTKCEITGPEPTFYALNKWADYTDPLIFGHLGSVNKRIGDSVMAVYGHEDPILTDIHPAIRALLSGLDMLDALESSRSEIRKIAELFGDMNVRVGVHYGPVMSGALGSELRKEYGYIGDNVNVAARVEPKAGHGELWTTQETLDAIGEDGLPDGLTAIFKKEEVLKGRSKSTRLYQIIRTKPS